MPDSISPFDRPLTNKSFFNIVYFSLIPLSGLSIISRSLKKSIRLKTLGLAENKIDAEFAPESYDLFMRSMNHLRLALQMNAT